MQATVWETSETCTIDFNPAHVVYGDTAQLLEPEVLELVLLQAIQATMLTPAFCEFKDDGTIEFLPNWTDYINIQEMEVAFNFQVPNSLKGPMQQALKGLRAPRNMRRAIHEEAGSFTLEYTTKGVGKDSIYNKSMELEARSKDRQESEVSTFRFESRLRRKRLDKFQMRLLSNISPTGVWEALNQRFECTQWSQSIGSFGGTLKLLGEIDYRKTERMLGFSEAVRQGLDAGLELGTRRARIKEAKELGIPIGVCLDQLAESGFRIDPWSGWLVSDSHQCEMPDFLAP